MAARRGKRLRKFRICGFFGYPASPKRRSPGPAGASPFGTGVGCQSILRLADRRSMTVMAVMMVVVPVMPMMPVRMRVPIPSRVPVCGIAIVVRLTIAVDIAVISPAAATGYFDNVRDRWGAGSRYGGARIRRYSGSAQSQRTEQRQNCCTHCRRPSKLHRNNDARSVGISARNRPRRVRQFTDAEKFAKK